MSSKQRQALPSYVTVMAGWDQEPVENSGLQICLFRDKKPLIVQAPGLPEGSQLETDFDPERSKKLHDHAESYTEILETLLASITFGHSNWAFLVTGKDGGYSIQYRNRAMYKVTCPPWAPLVYEEDINYTVWQMSEIEGIWNGQEVDIHMSWNDMSRRFLDLRMRGHLLLSGLDLAYDVVGHIINSDGEIIGLMTEPAIGRAIQICDRSIVYAAFSKLQQRGLSCPVNSESILISEGKVRLLSVSGVRQDTAEWLADYYDLIFWNELDDMFDELKYSPNEYIPSRLIPTEPRVFTIIPPPQKPLNDVVSFMSRCFTYFTNLYQFDSSIVRSKYFGKDKHSLAKRLQRRSSNRRATVLLAPEATASTPLNITSVRERYSTSTVPGTKNSRAGRRSVCLSHTPVLESGIASIAEIED